MPPQSNMRKGSTQTMATGESHVNPLVAAAVANSAAHPRRTASGRAVRANTTRPTNYYARTFGNGISATDRDDDAADASNSDAVGFFPALQFFTDAITATPKEVIKHFTLLKEVESKILGPQEELGQVIDSLMQQPVPLRKQTTSAANSAVNGQGLLALTANNSSSGSANVSMINGMAGQHSVQSSLAGSTAGEDMVEAEADNVRRHQYHSLRALTHSLLGNMDEKNVVLSEANRILALQHKRLDSVWPHVEEEIGEDARLGSMTHWAYSDNRQKTKAPANNQSRRDGIAATNALANVAAAIHDNEVAQARRDAGREARGEKKGKRAEPAGDSDFDDKPRKAPKVGKGKAATNAATGLGISTNGEPVTKRRKNAADKQMAPPAMERTTSTTGRSGKVKDTPRGTPVIDQPIKKQPKAKPGPPKGKKIGGSTHNSPMLASSPLASSFNPATVEVPPGTKSQAARLRQNSSTTNLRLQNVVHEEEAITSRPPSSSGKANGTGEKSNGRRKAQDTTDHEDRSAEQTTKSQLNAASEQLKREELDRPEGRSERRQPASRSGSDRDISRKASGRQSKVGTPRTDSFPDGTGMVRSRSTRRSKPANGESQDSDSDEPQMRLPGGGSHKRQQSNSHLVKQLAPFNRSPDLDRHRSGDDNQSDSDKEVEDDQPTEQEKEETAAEQEVRRASTRRPISRRGTINTSPAPNSRDSTPPLSPPPTSIRGNGRTTAAALAAKREAEAEAARREVIEAETVANIEVEEEEEEEESDHDPDDPDEPKYCYCNRGSYGEMVACDNDNCPREWFHLGCTELREAPSEEEKWYCKECRPLFGQKVGRKGKTGRGRGG